MVADKNQYVTFQLPSKPTGKILTILCLYKHLCTGWPKKK